MLFIVGLPVVQILLFCYAIGHDPTGLKLAVANHEMSGEMIMEQFCPVHTGCNQTMLSCRYLDMLVKNKSMVVVSAMQITYSSSPPSSSPGGRRTWKEAGNGKGGLEGADGAVADAVAAAVADATPSPGVQYQLSLAFRLNCAVRTLQ